MRRVVLPPKRPSGSKPQEAISINAAWDSCAVSPRGWCAEKRPRVESPKADAHAHDEAQSRQDDEQSTKRTASDAREAAVMLAAAAKRHHCAV